LQNDSHDTQHDQANSFRLIEIFRADIEFNIYNMYVHVRYFGVSLFIVLVLFDSFCHPIPSWRVTVLKTEVPSYILPPVDLLGQDGRPSTDGGLVVLLVYAHVRNLPWEYDFEFDVLQVVEAAHPWPETATWVNYGGNADAVGGGMGVHPHIAEFNREYFVAISWVIQFFYYS
jgi:hypothetical protein